MNLTPEQEATDLTTSSKRLWELAATNVELQQLVATNSAASPDLLEQLGETSNRQIRAAVAANPNTPPDVLYRLGAEFPQAFLNNPVLLLLLLANPNLFADMPLEMVYQLLKQKAVPSLLLEWAANQQDCRLRQLVIEHPDVTSHLLDRLVVASLRRSRYQSSEELPLLERLFLHPQLSPESKQQLLDSPHINRLIGSLIGQPHAPTQLLDYVARTYPKLHQAIAQYPATATSTLVWLANETQNEKTLEAIGCHPNTPWSVLQAFLRKGPYSARIGVSKNPNFPWDKFAADAMELNYGIIEVLKNPTIPPSVLETLSFHPIPKICLEVARHPKTPVSVLETLAWHPTLPYPVGLRTHVAANRAAPISLLKQLAEDHNEEVQAAVAANPNTPAECLIQISHTPHWKVRGSLQRNPNTPGEALLNVFRNEGEWGALLNHPNTPVEVLEALMPGFDPWFLARLSISVPILKNLVRVLRLWDEDGALEKRCQMARNRTTPAQLLEMLARDRSVDVRREVAQNLNTPPTVLRQLASDPDEVVRCSVARHSKTDEATLEHLLADPSVAVRENIAINCGTPTRLLKILAQAPPGSDIHRLIARHSSTPFSLKVKLATDASVAASAKAEQTPRVTWYSDILRIERNRKA